jgi:hypothetical protein
MQKFNDSNRRPNVSPVVGWSVRGNTASFNASDLRSLDDIGGELLAGSGFENEKPESEFAPAGEES